MQKMDNEYPGRWLLQEKVSQTSLGLRQPQYCQVTNNVCRTGVQDNNSSSATNLLFAMVLGWCYVLSARHIELRGVAAYSTPRARHHELAKRMLLATTAVPFESAPQTQLNDDGGRQFLLRGADGELFCAGRPMYSTPHSHVI